MRRLRLLWLGLVRAVQAARIVWQRTQARLHGLREAVPGLPAPPDDEFIEKDWRGLPFVLEGKKGETLTVQVAPDVYLRGKRFVATDSAPRHGMGTLIRGIFVGQKPQMVVFSHGILTLFFHRDAVSGQIAWDTCDPGLFITFQVEFLTDCTWKAELWGNWVSARRAEDQTPEVTVFREAA